MVTAIGRRLKDLRIRGVRPNKTLLWLPGSAFVPSGASRLTATLASRALLESRSPFVCRNNSMVFLLLKKLARSTRCWKRDARASANRQRDAGVTETWSFGVRRISESCRLKQLPVAFRNNVDDAVVHLDSGLIVDGIDRNGQFCGPRFGVG
jgi:hypothetical protein